MTIKHFVTVALALATGLTLIVVSPAFPHGEGVIRLASKQVAIGGTISLTGEKLGKNADLRLELRGILDSYPAGRIRSDVKGMVSASVTIPPAVPIGSYTLVVIAVDGDVVARTDLSVGPAAAVTAAKKGMPHMAPDMRHMEATAEMMEIERTTTPVEWALIAAVILLSFAAGVFLLSRSKRMMPR